MQEATDSLLCLDELGCLEPYEVDAIIEAIASGLVKNVYIQF